MNDITRHHVTADKVRPNFVPQWRKTLLAPVLWLASRFRPVATAALRLGLMTQQITLTLVGPDGAVKDSRLLFNTVTTNGKDGIADNILASPTVGKPTHMAVGTGSPGANALGTELDRNAFTSKTRSGAIVTCVCDWAAGDATGPITEAGWFTASSGGNMWVSASFAVINKGTLDTLNVSWALTIA
jgi:hypothetical protein